MISFSGSLRIFLLVEGCDMRKGSATFDRCAVPGYR